MPGNDDLDMDFDFDSIPEKTKVKKTTKQAAAVSSVAGYSSREASVDEPIDAEKVQYAFGLVSKGLRDKCEALRKAQEPAWPKEYFLSQLYIALEEKLRRDN